MESWIQVVQQALTEDIGSGDVTTNCTIPENKNIEAVLVAKESGIVAGLQVFAAAFRLLNEKTEIIFFVQDSETVTNGDRVATVKGAARTVLTAERVALNFLQRMSGIATLTQQMVQAVKGTKTKILDTRKTVPGLRYLDKWAVRLGGGENHRFGLFDMVLIKDNHIAACGSISAAVQKVRQCDTLHRRIEVEVRNLDELQEALSLNVDRILLDNMDLPMLERAVEITGGQVPLEASGNVTLKNVRSIAETGVDYISVGSLTHSVKAMDFSLRV